MLIFVDIGSIHAVVREHAEIRVVADDWVDLLSNFVPCQMTEASAPFSWAICATSVAPLVVAPFTDGVIVIVSCDVLSIFPFKKTRISKGAFSLLDHVAWRRLICRLGVKVDAMHK